jgi:site-specific DNA-methyltransferase (adenine-specific)
MRGAKTLMSHASDEWETPQDFFDKLNEEFKFNFDLAATHENRKCHDFTSDIHRDDFIEYAKRNKGMMCWCNPPYSNQRIFLDWAISQKQKTVFLLPARTDTKLFHELIYSNEKMEVRFIKGRLKFSGSKWNAPFPSMIVVYRP